MEKKEETLSAVLIVKNEEEMLSQCLASLKGIDEIVVTDTGSEDLTVDIAKLYTDKIFEFPWIDSFCKARNFANSKATGDWILTIDADEELLTPVKEIYKVIKNTEKEVLNITLVDKKGNEHKSPRLFRNDKSIYWKGDIHNYLSKTAQQETDIVICYGYSPAHKKDPDRALRIAKKAVQENPNLSRERYYLAREYYYRRDWQKAIDELDEYFKRAKWRPEINDAWLMRARCLAEQRKWEEAVDSAWQALKYNANFKEALDFISKHMDPVNAQRWRSFKELADNRDVLFVRGEKKEKKGDYYDSLYEKSEDMSRYTNIYKEVGSIVKEGKVLDIGCGLAKLSDYVKDYQGFDIAQKTIAKVKARGLKVWVGSALDKKNYKKVDFYTLLEVLEHIEKDKEVLELIPEGAKIVFSVPSFEDVSHVRVFDQISVRERYKELLDIKSVTPFSWDSENRVWIKAQEVTKPFILLVQAQRVCRDIIK